MDKGLIHKIAILSKDFYTVSTIDDLFLFSGAEYAWLPDTPMPQSSARVTRVYDWVAGIEQNSSDQLDTIIEGVASQLLENESIPEGDKSFIRKKLNLPSKAISHSFPTRLEVPNEVEHLLEILIKGFTRAIFPLVHRRKNLQTLKFDNEYDVQDFLHSMMRPWIKDIRAEEYTPSYSGTSSRIDFLLTSYGIVLEVKYVRDSNHAKRIGNELIVDVAHYRIHPKCQQLLNVIYDPRGLIQNPDGLIADLDGVHESKEGNVKVTTFILSP